MKYDILYNFISPITGKIKIDNRYTIIGDNDSFSYSSPILIDIKQDIIDLRRKISGFDELDKLDNNRIWIGNYLNEPTEKLQIGIINLPTLSEAVFPNPLSPIIGDFRIPNPTFDYLSPFDWVMSGPFLPQIYATKYDTLGNPVGTDVSSSLAMTQVRAAQIMKRFDNANFIVGSSTVDFNWENPKMYLIPETLKQLYGLGTTYTFTKAQSLGALETGLLKNTVSNGTGTLSKAISGEDYVNTADIPIGNLVIMDPLYPTPGHKLICPTSISSRKNNPDEFGYPVANTIDILTGIAAKFTKFAVTGLIGASLIKIDEYGELKPAIADTDYTTPSEIETILSIISVFQTAYDVFTATTIAKDISQDVEIVTIQAKDISQDVEIATVEATAIAAEGTASTALATAATAEASVVTLGATVEAEIAALAGVQTLSILATILGFIGVAAGGKGYGDYIRGQTLNVKNTWKAADLNDEGHNAVGDYEFRFPSGYSSDDRGHSTLWFDSIGRGSENKSEAGLRLFSWDSGGDHIGSDDPIAPLHIGLFGYQNKYHTWPFSNPTAKYKGFIFSIPDFHNESSSDDDYRFPKKFGLYDVTRTIGTWTSNKYGWDSKNTIFEYDYNNFCFYKNVKFNNYTDFEETVDFQKDVKFLSKGAIKIPVGSIAERPSNPTVGMLRFDEFLMKLEFPILNGFTYDWHQLATESFVNNKIFDINSNTSGQLNSNRLSGYPSNNSVFLRGDGNWAAPPNVGTVTSVGITGSTGLGITGSPITSSGTINLTLGSQLQALSAFASTGLMTRTASNTYAGRTLIGSTGISITNGDGVSGNPTIGLETINITGAVTGSGTNSIPTILNTTQTIASSLFSINWTNTTSSSKIINHYLLDSSPLASSVPQFVNTVQVGTGGSGGSSTERSWSLRYIPGYASTPVGGNFTISYYHNTGFERFPLTINCTGIGDFDFSTTLYGKLIVNGTLDLGVNKLIGLATPTLSTDGVNKSYADSLITNIAISSLSGYPSNSSLYLNGLGSWVNPLRSLSITTDSISSTTSAINFANIVYMNSNALYLTATTNYGILYNSSLSFTEFRGFSGYVWKTGTTSATERMRLTSSGLDLNSSKLLNVLTPTVSTDGANKSYVDSAVSSANTKLQYFGSWDSAYPIYVTRSMYLNNSYTPPIREYGTYGFLNSSGNTHTATDSPVYDIKCNGRIRGSEFNAWSSKNIKNILSIGKKAGEEASKILQDIPIVKYNYKDPIVDGKGEFFGVISEEILDYLPNYVTTNEFRFTPNIMMFGKLNSIDYQYFTILLQDDKTLDASFIGKKIQILKDNSSISGILESIENKFLTVKLESKVIITEKDLDVFVYGSYEDCPTVSLKHLSELSLCALVNCIERINKLEQIKEV